MSRLQRALAPVCLALGFAALLPASAMAGSTVTFPNGMPTETTVSIVDPSPSSPTVQLTVTAANAADLSKTKVLLGRGSYVFNVIGTDGVREVDDDFEDVYGNPCTVAGAPRTDVPVTVGNGSFTANLPKGDVVSFEQVDIGALVTGPGTGCTRDGQTGVVFDFFNDSQEIDGITWAAPATPAVTATGGRRQFTLNFAQESGTSYELWRVVGGVREATPLRANLRGTTGDTQFVIDMNDDGKDLPTGTAYALQVRAVRQFTLIANGETEEPSSGYTSVFDVSTNPVQTVTLIGAPAAVTTSRSAVFTWVITAPEPGDAISCWLDIDGPAAAEIPCTATGASLTGLSLGAHTLTVYPADGESTQTASWTVVAESAPPLPPTVPTPPTAPKANPNDLDGDGIENSWLVGGKPAAAPKTPKVAVTGTRVKLTLAAAPKGAKSIRVYRADGKGGYKLVKTVKAGSKTFTDTKVKAGTTYKYKTVAVNAKGQQGKASGAATAKVTKKK